jgi:chromosome segregation ATPase
MEPASKLANGLWNGFAASMDLHDGSGPVKNGKHVVDKKRQRLSGDGSSLVLHEKRINELQGQLMESNGRLSESNERIHSLEIFVKQQEAWLDQEREAHEETRTALEEATQTIHGFAMQRFALQMQLEVIPELEEKIATLQREFDQRLLKETVALSTQFQAALSQYFADAKLETEKRAERERAQEEQRLEELRKKCEMLETVNSELDNDVMRLTVHRQLAEDRAQELQQALDTEVAELNEERNAAYLMAHDVFSLEEQLKESTNQLAMVQANLQQSLEYNGRCYQEFARARQEIDTLRLQESAQACQDMDTLRTQLTAAKGELEVTKGELEVTKADLNVARQELHDAYVEASRLGEELQEKNKMLALRENASTSNEIKVATKTVIDLACKLGDPKAQAPALNEKISYSKWRLAVNTTMQTLSTEGIAHWEPEAKVVQGAVTVISTLTAILLGLFLDVGQKNEKLIEAYDKLAAHAKEVDAELDRCKCPDLRAEVQRLKNEIAQTEKEMAEAETIIHRQDGTNKDLSIRVKRRSALESVEVNGDYLLRDLVKVQDQRSQLTKQVESLERSLASSRTAAEKLRIEKSDLAVRLAEAEKQIPAPRALLYVKDLGDNVEDLRRSLGPIAEQTCAQCTLYLGKAREAERRRNIAEQAVVEEQRRLVKMTQDNKLFIEAKVKVTIPRDWPDTFCSPRPLQVPRTRGPGASRR